MHTLATIMGLASGFTLVGYAEPPERLLATSLAVNACLAPLSATIAFRHGRSPAFWGVVGMFLGVWAFAAVVLVSALPERWKQSGGGHEPPSEAA